MPANDSLSLPHHNVLLLYHACLEPLAHCRIASIPPYIAHTPDDGYYCVHQLGDVSVKLPWDKDSLVPWQLDGDFSHLVYTVVAITVGVCNVGGGTCEAALAS